MYNNQRRKGREGRRVAGSVLAEYPLVLFVLLIAVAFPLINLVTAALRTTFFYAAARDATHAAAKGKGYADISQRAQAQARATTQAFTGVTVDAVEISIIESPLSGGAVMRYNGRVPDLDVSRNVYYIEVHVKGQTAPLVSVGESWFGRIPGLNAPIALTATSKEFSEYPLDLVN